ncbi:MAG: carboxypeptidase regulatory-like domain-containing protein, partial [Acidobacteriota bacterium]
MKRNFMWVLVLVALAAVPLWAAGDDGKPEIKTEVVYPCTVTLSPPFRDLPVNTDKVTVGLDREIPNPTIPRVEAAGRPESSPSGDGALQSHPGLLAMPGTVAEFAGISNLAGVAPPDTQGDIGPSHYVQWVNLHLAAWSINRSTTPFGATLVLGPITGTTIWSSLGGPCAANNDGDPIVLWDRFRNRWVISQFNLPDPYYQAIAVSQTADPTGSWYLYCFQYDATNMNDYPKFGIWPDGYYMTVNQFANMSSWAGAGLCVFEADKMINGDPTARMLKVDLGAINSNYGSILPAHFEGMANPPAASPCYFLEVDDGAWIPGYPNDALRLWEGHVNWVAGTFTVGVAGEPNQILDTAAFDPLCVGNRNCIPQPGTTQRLDSLGDRLMYRLQYRNFGSYEAMVVNHSVDVGSGRSGVRWYELRKSGTGPWSIFQQGTYAPTDGLSRWMGSAAQDHMGNLAVGYSVSDASSMYPSIYYAGRLASDPAGDLTQGEALMYLGAASQTGVNRWGDYSTMSIDPDDDCTFWYTTEYSTGSWNWATRIGAFKYGTCSVGPTGTLAGTVTDSATTLPLSGATVTATNGTITVNTNTAADGTYSMTLPVTPPNYDVAASLYGYVPGAASGLSIADGMTTTQDFALAPAPSHVVSGTVTDAATGWPLYASLAVAGPGYPGATVWNDPVTGFYSITLADGIPYDFTVTSYIAGYEVGAATVTPLGADVTQDFALSANVASCIAPGYTLGGGVFESFDTTALPAGWTVTNNGGACTWVFNNPGGRSNLTGGSGNFAVADSDECGSGTTMNTELRTPVIDFTGVASVPMTFRSDYNNLSSSESADVDVSVNGAAGPWTNVWHRNVDARGPMLVTLDLSAIAGNQANVMVRFHYVAPGWDWWWEVDDVAIGAPTCTAPAAGGLIVGNVYDANTNLPLNGAAVDNATTGGSATAAATPDPVADDGFYYLYGAEPTSDLTASFAGYGPDSATVTVPHLGSIRQDFHLATGRLEATPSPIEVTVSPSAPTTTATLTLSETGGADVAFDIRERDGPLVAPEGRAS